MERGVETGDHRRDSSGLSCCHGTARVANCPMQRSEVAESKDKHAIGSLTMRRVAFIAHSRPESEYFHGTVFTSRSMRQNVAHRCTFGNRASLPQKRCRLFAKKVTEAAMSRHEGNCPTHGNQNHPLASPHPKPCHEARLLASGAHLDQKPKPSYNNSFNRSKNK